MSSTPGHTATPPRRPTRPRFHHARHFLRSRSHSSCCQRPMAARSRRGSWRTSFVRSIKKNRTITTMIRADACSSVACRRQVANRRLPHRPQAIVVHASAIMAGPGVLSLDYVRAKVRHFASQTLSRTRLNVHRLRLHRHLHSHTRHRHRPTHHRPTRRRITLGSNFRISSGPK